MSASKQKKERREARAQGTDKQTLRAQEQAAAAAAKRRRTTVIAAVVIVIVLLLAGLGVVFGSSGTYRSVAAAQVGEQTLSAAEYNYYYVSVRNDYLQQYNQILSQLGTSMTAAEMETREYQDGKTWKEVFEEEAEETIRRVTTLCALAERDGMTIGEDYQTQLDEAAKLLADAAEQSGMSLDAYVAAIYGRGMDYALWQELAARSALADSCAAQRAAAVSFDDSEVLDYYEEHAADYKGYTYRSFLIPAVVGEGDDEDAVYAEAEAKADEFISRLEAGEAFSELAIEYATEGTKSSYEESDLTLNEDIVASKISSAYSEWVLDPARRVGDITAITDREQGYVYIVTFLGASSEDDATKIEKALPDMQQEAMEEALAVEMESYPFAAKSMGMYFADKAV